MNELYKLDISENTIKSMIEINPDILAMNDSEIIEKEHILKSIGCTENIIRNIISSNPTFLSIDSNDIKDLLTKLYHLGFRTLNILLDSNPYILNMDIENINKYINKRLKKEKLSDIIDDLETNPYIFNEI